MDLGVHLPLIEFGHEGQSLARLRATVDVARDLGFAAVAANDHFVFPTPWLDGLTALAAVVERSGELTLATTVSLVSLRGPVPLAKTLAALDVLSGGRLIAGVGPGSSSADYDAAGVPFVERWQRFEQAVIALRTVLSHAPVAQPAPSRFQVPTEQLRPAPVRESGIPLWIGSWGSAAGLRRVARLADGWLASAYNTTPDGFAAAAEQLTAELRKHGHRSNGFPNAVATMWTWITEDRGERDRILREVLAPILKRDPDDLAGRVCVGSADWCAELLSRYARAGCERVYLWPLGDEARQLELIAQKVTPSNLS